MKNVKIWLLLAALSLALKLPPITIAKATDTEIIPLPHFLNENDTVNDLNNTLYVIDRCEAVVVYTISLIKNEKNSEATSLMKNLSDTLTVYSIASAKLIDRQNINGDAATSKHLDTVKVLLQQYSARFNAISNSGRDLGRDEFYTNEMKTCVKIKDDIIEGRIK
jgi:hypothetical protein